MRKTANLLLAIFFVLAIVMGSQVAESGNMTSFKIGQISNPTSHGVVTSSKQPGLQKLNIIKPVDFQHGTHLCSADEHCGTGHKCCSGHCKAVSTCG